MWPALTSEDVLSDFGDRTPEEEEFLWTIKLNFTKPCTREVWFIDGPKIVTDKDVGIWDDKRLGIVADNSVDCESFCLQFEECDCFIYDLGRNRCNLKTKCSGGTDGPVADYNSCMFERPPEFMKCTTGPQGKPCENGCTPRGLKPDCLCGGPGLLGPVPGYSGDWCEKKDECFEKPEGTKCGNGGECKINSKGLMECEEPCTGKVENDACSTPLGAGTCGFGPGGQLTCIVTCAGKAAGTACPLAPGVEGKCDSNGQCTPCGD